MEVTELGMVTDVKTAATAEYILTDGSYGVGDGHRRKTAATEECNITDESYEVGDGHRRKTAASRRMPCN